MRRWIEPAGRHDVGETFAQEFALAGTLAPGDAILHAWLPQPTLLFTQRDTRAPGYEEAAAEAMALGYAPVVRASGGEAVPLDHGTVCVDLLMPGEALQLRAAFDALAAEIVAAVARLGLRATIGRVEGAYCPGDYDIAVGGRKFAGLAQRRTRQAIAVHSFVLVEGLGLPRCTHAARIARKLLGEPGPEGPPPCPVASLAESSGRALRAPEFLAALDA
jgi:octanoyl-[GcvH]:protein N-octanoyltransferase